MKAGRLDLAVGLDTPLQQLSRHDHYPDIGWQSFEQWVQESS